MSKFAVVEKHFQYKGVEEQCKNCRPIGGVGKMIKEEQIKEMANLMAETMLKNYGLCCKWHG